MRVIGVTGGICGGKSTVCKFLREAGAVTVDCDALGHEAYLPGTRAHSSIVKEFSPALPSLVGAGGIIDRKVLGAHVFSDAAAMAKLCGIVWPAIASIAKERLTALEKSQHPPSVVFVEAALLLDAGWDTALCDEVWVAYAPRAVARARLMKRNSLTPEDASRFARS